MESFSDARSNRATAQPQKEVALPESHNDQMENELLSLQRKIMDLESKLTYDNQAAPD